jgi:hypothetical protein
MVYPDTRSSGLPMKIVDRNLLDDPFWDYLNAETTSNNDFFYRLKTSKDKISLILVKK